MKNPYKEQTKDIMRRVRERPLGSARATYLIRELDKLLALCPLDQDAPPEVTEARDEYRVTCEWLRQMVANLTASTDAVKAAAVADVEAAGKAIREGKQPSTKVLQRTKAAEAVDTAAVSVEAGEAVTVEAWARVIDAAVEAWPAWSHTLATSAPLEHDDAAQSLRRAAERTAAAHAHYHALPQLHAFVLRFRPDLRRAVESERRQGIDWYAATVGSAKVPLRRVSLPDPRSKNGAPVTFDLAVVLAAVAAAVESDRDFPAADWTPPTDPAHEAALSEPLDLSAPWVRRAVARSFGSDACALCGRPGADTVTDGRGLASDGGLVLVHTRCRQDVDKAEAKAARREGRRREGGLSPSDPRYGQAAAESAAQQLAEEERLERGVMTSEEFNRAAFPGQ